MTSAVLATGTTGPPQADPRRPRVTARQVRRRRVVGLALVVVPVAWALTRALPTGTTVVNRDGLPLLGQLLSAALHPALDPAFLGVVARATVVTVVFATLGTAVALLIGAAGGLVLSDVAWPVVRGRGRRAAYARAVLAVVRTALRGVLVAVRAIHELVWALLFVSVLGLDPLVAVLAIALPFGAQTAKIFGEILDGVPPGPLTALRATGVRSLPALAYAAVPQAVPLLLSYSFYRFECAIRSAVVLGVVGVGGLGQELVVSLASRNWDEVWTLIGAVVVLSAAVDLWSGALRTDLAVASCSDWSPGTTRGRRSVGSRWSRASVVVALVGLAAAWVWSGVSWAGLASARTGDLTVRLLDDLWPPALPPGGWASLLGACADTLAMAVLAMVVAVAITVLVGPWASRAAEAAGRGRGPLGSRVAGRAVWVGARGALVVLRAVPPTVWAVLALMVLFPGVLPGAVALGLYTGGILGRLVAEAWEGVDQRPRARLRAAGVGRTRATLAATVPPAAHHLVTYTAYRFEICVRDTAIVGVVGAAGLGRLLAENLAVFRFPAVTTLLLASFAVSVASEVAGRRVRRALRAEPDAR